MGLEFTRGNNTRCPPFLVGGLMIMCLFLLCNWWSLSSQNFELLRQNDNLAEQLRINGEELRKCKDCQSQLAKQEVQIRQIKDSDQELQQVQLQCQKEKEMCQTEKESLKTLKESQEKYIETLKTDKMSIEKKFEEQKQKLDELQKDVKRKIERINELEKDVEEKEKLIKLEKSISSNKGNNFPSIDMKRPIAEVLAEKNAKKNEYLDNPKVEQNESPKDAKPESLQLIGGKEENNGGEAKNDDIGPDATDPREEEMLDPRNNLENR